MVRLPLDKGARGYFHIYTEMLNPKEPVLCAAAYGIDMIVTPGETGGSDNSEVGESAAADDTILYRLPW